MAYVFQDDVQINEDLSILGNTTTTGHLITTTKADIIVDNGNQTVRFPVGIDGNVLKANSATPEGLEWSDVTGGSGEANNGENVGNDGVGIFFTKSGVNLQFKNITAFNNLLSVIDDTANTTVDLRINQGSIDINNLGNTPLLVSGGGTSKVSLASGAVLVGNGTGAIEDNKLAPVGDFVGTTDQQDITNKNLIDTSTFIVDSSDNTIRIGFNAVGGTGTTTTLTTSQSVNRNLTLPDANDTLVGRLTADTFSNKTIVAPSNNVASDSLKAASGAVLVHVRDSAEPTIGQVLTATGNTSAEWQTPASTATANNVGTAGSGFFIAKVGNELRFKNIAADSNNTVEIIDNTSANTVQVAVIESALNLNNFGGSPLTVPNGGTGQTTLTTNAVLVGNGTGAIDDIKQAPSGDFVGTTDIQTLTNKTIVDASNNVAADALKAANGNVLVRVVDSAEPTSGQVLTATSNSDAEWQTPTAQATASNEGNEGVGVFIQKTGNNLEFKNIFSENNLLSVIDDTANATIDITVNQSNFDINNLGNTPLNVISGGTGQTTFTANAVLVGNGTGAIDDIKQAPVGDFVGTTDQQDITNKNLVDSSTFIVDSVDNTIRIGFDATGTIGTTTTLQSTQTTDRTLILPNASDTLVGNATTDILTNKTIVDTTNNIATDALKAASGAVLVRVVDSAEPTTGQVLTATSNSEAEWQTPASTATADNVGTLGTGFFIAKIGNELRFKNIAADSNNTVEIIDNTSANTVQVAVIESALNLNNFGGTPLTVPNGGTGQTTLTANAVLVGNGTGAIDDVKPAPNGDFVGTTDQQDLTNKNLVDSSTFIVDAVDNSVRIAFNAIGVSDSTTTIATSQTSNITLTTPDITDTLVGRTTTDTMNNKTIFLLSAGNTRIIDVATPSADTDAANKGYVDMAIEGLDFKESVKAGTVSNGDLANDFENGDVIDGVTLETGNRILIKDQSNGIQNGIYIVQASGTPLRSDDFADSSNVAGSFTFVEEGTVNADNAYVVTNNQGNDTVGSNSIQWTVFSSTGGVTANNAGTIGIGVFDEKTGNNLAFKNLTSENNLLTIADNPSRNTIDLTVNQSNLDINNLGNTPLNVISGGTGQTTFTANAVLVGNGTGAIDDIKQAPSGDFVGTTDIQTLTNKTIVDVGSNVAADALKAANGNVLVRVVDSAEPTSGQVLTATSNSEAEWQTPTAQATASNEGNEGIGVFIQKTGNNLEFKNIFSENNLLSVVDDTANATIDLVVNQSNFDINNLGNTPLNVSSGGTGQTTLTANAVLVGNGTGAIDDIKQAPSGDFVGTTDIQTLTNKTIVDVSNNVATDALKAANGNVLVRVVDSAEPTSGQVLTATSNSEAEWQTPTAQATASNEGNEGVGVFIQKTGNNLEFKNIFSENNLLTVIDDTANATIDLIVNQSSFDINNLGNTPLNVISGGTGQTTLTANAVLVGNGTGAIDDIKQAPVGDFVGTTDQQDLTNKNLVDSSTFIVDSVDNTIRIGFDATGTTGTTTTLQSTQTTDRTLILPNASDTLIGNATTDTLTNKTIVDATNNVAADALKAASGTVLVRVVDSAEPTTGQVLTATSNTNAEWQDTSTAGRKIGYNLSSIEIRAPSTSFDDAIYFIWDNSAYNNYSNGFIRFSTTIVNRNLTMRWFDDTGATSLGSITAENSGIYNFAITNPTVNSDIILQVQRGTGGGANPIIRGIHADWDY